MELNLRKITAFACALLSVFFVRAQSIRDVHVEQVGNTIEVSYLLSDKADIQLSYSTDGGVHFSQMKALTGDVGHNVFSGRKKIIWDVLSDVDNLVTDNLRFKLDIVTDPVLVSIAGKEFHLSDFLYAFYKNNPNHEHSVQEYLQMFINFKLEVKAAEDAGMANREEFKKELSAYLQRAKPRFMQDEVAMDSMLQLTYKRLQRIRSAAHIAIECPENTDAKTTQEKLALIERARERVTTGGESFYQVAREVSTDPNVQETNGKLGYIIPLRYVYPLEDVVYNTPIGQVSPVIRTKYGFHVTLVEEERENIEVHAEHIMFMHALKNAKDSIYFIYNKLKKGANFEELARKYSQDKNTAARGGDVGWFSRSMMVKPFEDMAFDMYREGSFSEPFETTHGWHIIKYLGMRNYLPLDSVREGLTRQIRRDERYKYVEAAYLKKARAQYNIAPSMSDEDAKKYIEEHLEELSSEFRFLKQEYYDGILLFDILQREVWDKKGDLEEQKRKYEAQLRKKYPVVIHNDVLKSITQ